jgi:hypothetical protein
MTECQLTDALIFEIGLSTFDKQRLYMFRNSTFVQPKETPYLCFDEVELCHVKPTYVMRPVQQVYQLYKNPFMVNCDTDLFRRVQMKCNTLHEMKTKVTKN